MPLVDITPAFDGYRVWVSGSPVLTVRTLSNAARAATMIRELSALMDAEKKAKRMVGV
jgi:hypothetical protein